MKFKKILPIILYSLPICFFIVAFFGLITSGEDIFQGASTTPNIISDAAAAFEHNGRLVDMYAWSVINFFDYQFSFGSDTIFRLIDLAAAIGIFYILTDLVLSRRPKLETKDALIFNLIFLCTILTPHGPALYSGFSIVHNYCLGSLIALAFMAPFLKHLHGRKTKNTKFHTVILFILGLLFGWSINVTALAFLATIIILLIVQKIRHQKIQISAWQLSGIIGLIIGIGIIFIFGPGVNGYTTDPSYVSLHDYVSTTDVFNQPIDSTIRIANHIIKNLTRIIIPLLPLLIINLVGFIKFHHKKLPKTLKKPLIFIATFSIVHILCLSQIYYPLRMVLVIHLILVTYGIILASHYFDKLKPKDALAKVLCIVAIIGSGLALGAKIALTVDYHKTINSTLETIKSSNESALCINQSSIQAKNLPFVYLGQENFLTSWMLPRAIYDRTITFCEN